MARVLDQNGASLLDRRPFEFVAHPAADGDVRVGLHRHAPRLAHAPWECPPEREVPTAPRQMLPEGPLPLVGQSPVGPNSSRRASGCREGSASSRMIHPPGTAAAIAAITPPLDHGDQDQPSVDEVEGTDQEVPAATS